MSFFIIQKTFNRFSASLHLKVNELVSSHEFASNSVISTDAKTEHELIELSREYTELALLVEEEQLELEEAMDAKNQVARAMKNYHVSP